MGWGYEVWDAAPRNLAHNDNHNRAIAARHCMQALRKVGTAGVKQRKWLIGTETDRKYTKKYATLWRPRA